MAALERFECRCMCTAVVIFVMATATRGGAAVTSVGAPPLPKWRNSSVGVEQRLDALLPLLNLTELTLQLYLAPPDLHRSGLRLPGYDFAQECLAGLGGQNLSTAFPLPVGLGSSFDIELVRSVATAISDEARAYFNAKIPTHGYHGVGLSATCLGPNLNVARDARWGRNVEAFSEDPRLIAELGVAYIQAMQGIGNGTLHHVHSGGGTPYMKVNTVAKHLAAYSVDCYNPNISQPHGYPDCPVGRGSFNDVLGQSDLHETYLPAWKAAVQRGGMTGCMCSYNAINGVPMCANGGIMNTLMRDTWGFDGFVISDASAIHALVTGHGYVPDTLHASAAALNNGCDVDYGKSYTELGPLPDAVKANLVNRSTLVRAARRSLKIRMRLGLFDGPALSAAERSAHATPHGAHDVRQSAASKDPWSGIGMDVVDSPAHRALAARAAAASFVLLKHDGATLPLVPPGPRTTHTTHTTDRTDRTDSAQKARRVAVLGPAADDPFAIVNNYNGVPSKVVTMLGGIVERAARHEVAEVTAAPGSHRASSPDHGRHKSSDDDGHENSGDDGHRSSGDDGHRSSGDVNNEETFTHTNITNDDTPTYIYANVARSSSAQVEVVYIPMNLTEPGNISAAVARARDCCGTVIAVVTGEHESESWDRERLGVPAPQAALLAGLAAPASTNGIGGAQTRIVCPTKVVMVLVNGGAVDVSEWDGAACVGAIVEAWRGGEEAGTALASLLWGDTDFSGALPVTVYREAFATNNNFTDMAMRAPPGRTHRFLQDDYGLYTLYPFGYGLSYTRWVVALRPLANTKISVGDLMKGVVIPLIASAHNVGSSSPSRSPSRYPYELDGSSRPMLVFCCRVDPSADVHGFPRQWLGAFTKVHGVRPGSTQLSRPGALQVEARLLEQRWDKEAGRLVIVPGTYRVWLGGDGSDCTSSTHEFVVTTSNRTART